MPKILNFVKKIHYYSELFTSLLNVEALCQELGAGVLADLVAAGRRGAPRREVLTLRAAGVRRPAARRFLRCACYQLGNSMVHLIDGQILRNPSRFWKYHNL